MSRNSTPSLARQFIRPNRRLVRKCLVLFAMVVSIYSILFVYRSSIVVEGERYFCLFDDAMVSMCYASNWANSQGIVWNRGEFIEGYTSFVWTAILALLHLPGFSDSATCMLTQLLGIPILIGILVATARLSSACRQLPLVTVAALTLVALQANLLFLTLYGMETGFLCLLVTFGISGIVQSMQDRTGRIGPMLWFAVACLVRMDVLPIALALGFVNSISVRRARWRIALGIVAVGATLLAHATWRHAYYGDWLPNTYYLKLTGWPLLHRIPTGVRSAAWTVISLGLPFSLGLMALLKPRRWQAALILPATMAFAYQVYVGGDAWRLNRFVVPYLPALFVASACGMHHLIAIFFRHGASTPAFVARAALVAACLFEMLILDWRSPLLLDRPFTWASNRLNIRLVRCVDQVANPEATVAVGYAGAFPYFSKRHCYDTLGKCDTYIARLPADTSIPRAGHNKMDIQYTIETQAADILVHTVAFGYPPFDRHYYPIQLEVDDTPMVIFLRNRSPRVEHRRRISREKADELFRSQTNN
ncbi:MAG: hypothetical protein MI923_09405 [Phycisphaerales bacterium]|nr:hypothetical protein [Phycisphaerales bacterium]